MLPTHGRGPIRRFLLGSVTAKVLHDLSAAVDRNGVLARHSRVAGLPYKSVLCALDDSEEAEGVLRAAASLACAYRAHLSLVYVIPAPPWECRHRSCQYQKAMGVDAGAAFLAAGAKKGESEIQAPHAVGGGSLKRVYGRKRFKRSQLDCHGADTPLIVPEGAVLVAGSRAVTSGPGRDWGISIYTPVIVKYRDEKTGAKIQLEDLLR